MANNESTYVFKNMSYRNPEREDDYLLKRANGKTTFNYPINAPEKRYAHTFEDVNISCTEALQLRENDQYASYEIDNMAEDLTYDINEKINDSAAVVNNDNKIDDINDVLLTLLLGGKEISFNNGEMKISP